MYNEADGVIHDRDYLSNFQVDFALDLLFFWSENQRVLVGSKVVVDPPREKTMPNFKRAFHLITNNYEIINEQCSIISN